MIVSIAVFVVATGVVLAVGPRLARLAEAIANRLEIGQVIVGAVLLGVVTSLPGLVLTLTAASRGDTDLAVSNALGGVAAQTMFLAIADIAFRGGTLSSRVPTRQVAFQAALLLVLIALVLIGLGRPDTTVWRIHPVTVALAAAYGAGLWLSRRLDAEDPDDATVEVEGGRAGLRGKLGGLEDDPDVVEEEHRSWASLWSRFAVAAVVLAGAGFALALAGSDLADSTTLSSASVGVLFTSIATSTPELVTSVAAARRGAIGLAAGDIIGGNTFDTLFVAAADLASPGSVYAAAAQNGVVLAGFVLLLNAILLSGLVRQGRGARDTDIESVAVVGVWAVMAVVILVG